MLNILTIYVQYCNILLSVTMIYLLKGQEMHFPIVSGSNLLRQKVDLPSALSAELNLVLIAFQQWQQATVDTWLPFAERLELKYPSFRYYELPMIQRLNFLARTFINEGMRAGIPDQKARKRTITLYLDKEVFRRSLAIPYENDICVLLLDRQGKVLWRSEGRFSSSKGQDLDQLIQSQTRQMMNT